MLAAQGQRASGIEQVMEDAADAPAETAPASMIGPCRQLVQRVKPYFTS